MNWIDGLPPAERQQAVREQERWIAERGGSRRGYVLHYASSCSHDHAEAIYEADIEFLDRLMGKSEYHKAVEVLGEDYFA